MCYLLLLLVNAGATPFSHKQQQGNHPQAAQYTVAELQQANTGKSAARRANAGPLCVSQAQLEWATSISQG
jgi:hypothetical protein